MNSILKHDISIAAWNICGIKNKIDDPDFLKMLESHDIIVLNETFTENNSLHIKGFKCTNVFRGKKHKKARRNSGGISVLTKTTISNFVTPVRTTADHFIWMKISNKLTGYQHDTYCCCAYIPPINSPYYVAYPDTNLFELLNEDILYFSKIGHILLTGDFNARIGCKPDTLTREETSTHMNDLPDIDAIVVPPRCSMDAKVTTWGNNLLDTCFAHNLCVLNGRTLGDTEGNFTFFASGSSVIDLTIVDKDILSSTLTFKVHELTEFSSHCKIETILSCHPHKINIAKSIRNPSQFIKYFWNADNSPEKLNTTLKSKEFTQLKQKIITETYQLNKLGTSLLTSDVQKLTQFIHDQSCDKARVGKKSKCKTKRQKWFNADCLLLRKRVRRAANFLSRNPFNRPGRDEYISLNRQYRKLVKKTRKRHRELGMTKLIESGDRNEMWSLLSELRGKNHSTPLEITDLYNHFESLLNNPPKTIHKDNLDTLKSHLTDLLNPPSTHPSTLKSGNYTIDFITKNVKSLKNGKSAFTDGVLNEVLKQAIGSIAPILVKFFNHIELSEEYPTSWKSSFLIPLHKKGSQGDPNNYRGLAVGSNISKLYTRCLNEKLKSHIDANNVLSPHQFGFRDNFRTTDAIFSLKSITSYYKNYLNKPVYSCFVDFSKAFDSVNRTALLYKLGKVGITGKILKLIQNMYSESNYIIKSNGEYSIPLSSSIGVKQGCNLSPLFFNIFINDIHDIFDDSCKPTKINEWKVNSLSFADDLVLLSESKAGLENSISKLESYCKAWGLKVNASKTKVLVFNKPFKNNIKNLKFAIDGDNITVTNSYCYLGIEISNTGSFHKATDLLYKKSLRALFSLYSSLNIHSDEPNVKLFLKLFDSLIKPVLLYGCEVWGSNISKTNNLVAKLTNKFYRTLLAVPSHCSTTGIHVELGRYPIDINIHDAMLKYWFRLVTLPKTRLASHCYWALLDKTNLNDQWLGSIKSIINSSGQIYIWDHQKSLETNNPKTNSQLQKQLIKILTDLNMQTSHIKIESETKLKLLIDAKTQAQPSRYLLTTNHRKMRSLLTNLRLGTTDLEIEKGRKSGIPREQRFCKLCKSNLVEDEVHFLFVCARLNACRSPFINELNYIWPNFNSLPGQEKTKYLFFNEETPPAEFQIGIELLNTLSSTRESILKCET